MRHIIDAFFLIKNTTIRKKFSQTRQRKREKACKVDPKICRYLSSIKSKKRPGRKFEDLG